MLWTVKRIFAWNFVIFCLFLQLAPLTVTDAGTILNRKQNQRSILKNKILLFKPLFWSLPPVWETPAFLIKRCFVENSSKKEEEEEEEGERGWGGEEEEMRDMSTGKDEFFCGFFFAFEQKKFFS